MKKNRSYSKKEIVAKTKSSFDNLYEHLKSAHVNMVSLKTNFEEAGLKESYGDEWRANPLNIARSYYGMGLGIGFFDKYDAVCEELETFGILLFGADDLHDKALQMFENTGHSKFLGFNELTNNDSIKLKTAMFNVLKQGFDKAYKKWYTRLKCKSDVEVRKNSHGLSQAMRQQSVWHGVPASIASEIAAMTANPLTHSQEQSLAIAASIFNPKTNGTTEETTSDMIASGVRRSIA